MTVTALEIYHWAVAMACYGIGYWLGYRFGKTRKGNE